MIVVSDVAVPSARVPGLGLVLLLLKNSATDFFRYHDSHRQSLNKLERVEQLPPEELKEVYLPSYTENVAVVLPKMCLFDSNVLM